METSKLLRCGCESEFQDKEYGKGIRLHTVVTRPEKKSWRYTCTVCGGKK